MANQGLINGLNPLAYMGVNPLTPPDFITAKGAPTGMDYRGLQLGTFWLDTSTHNPPTINDVYVLVSVNGIAPNVANWQSLGVAPGAGLTAIQGNDAVPQLGPVITISGGTTGLSFTGAANIETAAFAGITANNGVVNLGTDNAANQINIGLGNIARQIDIGNSAAAHIINIGSATGASSTTIEGGATGSVDISANGGAAFLQLDSGVGVDLASSLAIADAITIEATDPAGGIQLLAGNNATQINLTPTGITTVGVAGVAVANQQLVTINSVTGELGSTTSTALFPWTVVAGAGPIQMVINNGYIANNAGTITFTLPVLSAVGSELIISGINNATGWSIAQNAGQDIRMGLLTTTTGVGHGVNSTTTTDAISLVCVVANTQWLVYTIAGDPNTY